jgi:hypothetical protein
MFLEHEAGGGEQVRVGWLRHGGEQLPRCSVVSLDEGTAKGGCSVFHRDRESHADAVELFTIPP